MVWAGMKCSRGAKVLCVLDGFASKDLAPGSGIDTTVAKSTDPSVFELGGNGI